MTKAKKKIKGVKKHGISNNKKRIQKRSPIRRALRGNKKRKTASTLFKSNFEKFLKNHKKIDLDESVKYGRNTLRGDFNSISRKYTRINKDKFLYKNSGEQRKKASKIIAYYLVYQPDSGYSVFPVFFRRKEKTVKAWGSFLKNKGNKIMQEDVLDTISIRKNFDEPYKRIALIGYGIPRVSDKDLFHGKYYKKD